MTFLRAVKPFGDTEFQRFRTHRMARAAVLTIILLPLLYSALYLWAFWDPFDETDKLPVAVVNNDSGATLEGEHVSAGEEVVKGLEDNRALDWHFVDTEKAAKGLEDGTYHFIVEIDPDFSSHIASPSSNDPTQATLHVYFDQRYNYLASVIGQTASQQIAETIRTKISDQAVDKVLVQVQEAGKGIRKAADGSVRLDDGMGELQAGIGRLSSGAQQLDSGATELDSGAHQLTSGSGRLVDGATQLSQGLHEARSGTSRLSNGLEKLDASTDQLGSGASQISGGVDQLVDTIDAASGAQGSAADAVKRAADSLRANPDPVSQEAVRRLDTTYQQLLTQGVGPQSQPIRDAHRLRDGATQLAYQLADPSSPYRSGMSQALSGARQLDNGITRLDDGGRQLKDGATQLHDGTERLVEGTGRLTTGTTDLVSGVDELGTGAGKLKDGTEELRTGLVDGATSAPNWSNDQRKSVADVLSDPVALSSAYENPAPTFGYGMAPFFISLALYVGAIITWSLLTPLQPRALATRLHPLRVIFASFRPALLIAVAQALVIVGVVHFILGLAPATLAGVLLLTVLAATVFLSIVQMFLVFFGPSVGRVLSMAALMLMLTSSGGLYPTATQPGFFRILHPINPATYTIDGLRAAIMGGPGLMNNVVHLLIFLVVALAVATLGAWRGRVWTLESLHPPVHT